VITLVERRAAVGGLHQSSIVIRRFTPQSTITNQQSPSNQQSKINNRQ
jgi:hypothetical protein